MKRISMIFAFAVYVTAAIAQDTNFAVRISCDFQQQAGAAELHGMYFMVLKDDLPEYFKPEYGFPWET